MTLCQALVCQRLCRPRLLLHAQLSGMVARPEAWWPGPRVLPHPCTLSVLLRSSLPRMHAGVVNMTNDEHRQRPAAPGSSGGPTGPEHRSPVRRAGHRFHLLARRPACAIMSRSLCLCCYR